MGLLGAIELAVLPAGGLLAEQRRREPLFDERLAHPVHRGGPTLHRLGDLLVVPTRGPAAPASALSKMRAWRVVDAARFPVRVSSSHSVRSSAVRRTMYLGSGMIGLQVGGDPHRKTQVPLEVNSGRVKQ